MDSGQGFRLRGPAGSGYIPSVCRPGYRPESRFCLSKSPVTWPLSRRRGLSAHLLSASSSQCRAPILSDHPHGLGESPRRGEGGLLTPLAPLSLLGAGPDWGGRSDLAGKEGRLCFQGWLSRPALENILSQLRALCCVVCFHGVWGEWWGAEAAVRPAAGRASWRVTHL